MWSRRCVHGRSDERGKLVVAGSDRAATSAISGHQPASGGRRASAVPGFDGGRHRLVAVEERGVDVDAAHDAAHAQPHDAGVVAAVAAPPRLPAVHPLAVLVVDACLPDRRLGLDQALARREELVGRPHDLGAEPRLQQVHVAHPERGRGGGGLARSPVGAGGLSCHGKSSSRKVRPGAERDGAATDPSPRSSP